MKLLFFLCRDICYNSLNVFSENIANELIKFGDYEIVFRPYPGEISECELAEQIAKEKYDAVLAFNAFKQQSILYKNQNLWDYLDIPFYDYVVDHPIYHDTSLKISFKKHRVLCMDRNHEVFIGKCYKSVTSADFMPLPGIRAIDEIGGQMNLSIENMI